MPGLPPVHPTVAVRSSLSETAGRWWIPEPLRSPVRERIPGWIPVQTKDPPTEPAQARDPRRQPVPARITRRLAAVPVKGPGLPSPDRHRCRCRDPARRCHDDRQDTGHGDRTSRSEYARSPRRRGIQTGSDQASAGGRRTAFGRTIASCPPCGPMDTNDRGCPAKLRLRRDRRNGPPRRDGPNR